MDACFSASKQASKQVYTERAEFPEFAENEEMALRAIRSLGQGAP
ncbi:MAG: hypothetical protein JWQ55_5393 [Rhodopila sp.]|jgi:hypothetical protein|nr:hypothetical protein [Rhodopila sp.]